MIIGTAGHIDHGKTSLIAALTGIDTDRLLEEKKRGITIELGFAHLDLENQRVGVVDVPGHERFVRHMVAGIAAVDLVLFVVAADEGMMPQSREHLQILHDLGIKRGAFLLTKADLVDEELLEMAKRDVEIAKEGTSLEGAPILAVDSLSGRGIEAVKEWIARALPQLDRTRGAFRLHIDRTFKAQGLGWIVTGTALSGKIQLDTELMLYPEKKKVRVRSIEIHGEKKEEATGGHRVALALAGEGAKFLDRGKTLSSLMDLSTTLRMDLSITYHEGHDFPLVTGMHLRVSVGTREVMATLFLYGCDELRPGERGFGQLRFEEEQLFFSSEILILRRSSPVMTLGAGRVLLSPAKRKKRYDQTHLASLRELERGGDDALFLSALFEEEPVDDLEALCTGTGLDLVEVERLAKALIEEKNLIHLSGYYLRPSTLETHQKLLLKNLEEQVKKDPLSPGVLPLSLYTSLKGTWPKDYFEALLASLISGGLVEALRKRVIPAGYRPSGGKKVDQMRQRLLTYYQEAGLSVQSVNGLTDRLGLDEKAPKILTDLVERQELVSIDETLYLSSKAYEQVRASLIDHLQAHGAIDLKAAKDRWQTSRKMTIALLEYFDEQGITVRKDDVRVAKEGV